MTLVPNMLSGSLSGSALPRLDGPGPKLRLQATSPATAAGRTDQVHFTGATQTAADAATKEAAGGLWRAFTKGLSGKFVGGLFLKYAFTPLILLTGFLPLAWAFTAAGFVLAPFMVRKGHKMIHTALEGAGSEKGIVTRMSELGKLWDSAKLETAEKDITQLFRKFNGMLAEFARGARQTMPGLRAFALGLRMKAGRQAYAPVEKSLRLMLTFREKTMGRILHKMAMKTRGIPVIKHVTLGLSLLVNALYVGKTLWFGK